jgi:hypothetical protein
VTAIALQWKCTALSGRDWSLRIGANGFGRPNAGTNLGALRTPGEFRRGQFSSQCTQSLWQRNASKAIEPIPDRPTAGSGVPQDTLTKADKLEIAYVRKVIPEPITRFAKATPEPSLPLPTMVPKVASRHWHDPNSIKVTKGSQDQRIKSSQSKKGQESKKSKNVEPSKAIVDLRPCRRPEGFAGLLRALNLSPGCDA